MSDKTIWILIVAIICFAAGFELALILTFGSMRKWLAYGGAYHSGRVSAKYELHYIIRLQMENADDVRLSILNEVLDLIVGVSPKIVMEDPP